MKQIFILLLAIPMVTVNAQTKKDSSLLKTTTNLPVKVNTPVLTPPKTLSKAVVNNLPKEKDLAIDQFQVLYEPMNKRYKLKCRVFNAGTTNIDLSLLGYFAYGSANTLTTAVSQSDPGFRLQGGPVDINIPYDLETDLPPGMQTWVNGRPYRLADFGRSIMITTRDPNAGWVFSTLNDKILKPGESVYAFGYDNAVWDSNITGAGKHRMYTLKIDPLNRIGDQNLDNNVVTYTMTNYY